VLQMAAIDVEVLEILRGQHDVAMQSHQDLAQATEEIADLHRTMRTILEQASMTQQKVDVICKDIRAMDNAKRNLTQSITILENFGTLTDALADLKETGSDRCALPSGFFFFFPSTALPSMLFQDKQHSVECSCGPVGERQPAVQAGLVLVFA
jgi:hypothetical protein